MYTKTLLQIFVLCLCLALLVGCQSHPSEGLATSAHESAPVQVNAPSAPLEVEPICDTPLASVEAFYAWYFDYVGGEPGEFRNPLVDKAYRDSPYLSAEFIQRVDEVIASFAEGGGFDPFLRAQDIPSEYQVQPGAEQNQVLLRERFGESWNELKITLVNQNGCWLIDDIQPAGE